MIKKITRNFLNKIGRLLFNELIQQDERTLLAIGSCLSVTNSEKKYSNIHDYEFKIFSQFGDDGLIQFLIKNIHIQNNTFIEFGVNDYLESNTRFLMMNNNWSGFVIDGSYESMNKLINQDWFWKYDLTCKVAFIDKSNINSILMESGFNNVGILHIDIDGNDYHILEKINLTHFNPSIIIMEYNSVFGVERAITIPYDPLFSRTKFHHSNLYFGASLKALTILANKLNYALVCCNSAGNNAYFIRRDLLNNSIQESELEKAFVESRFRESKNLNKEHTYLSGNYRLNEIKGLDVLNVITNEIEKL